MHLSGQLTDWSISDLLQIMQVTKKTGSLDIEGERRGRIHFREGAVAGAELAGTNGSYIGSDRSGIAEVIYVLSQLTRGDFSMGPADGPEKAGWDVAEILSDVSSLEALEGEVVDAGLFDASAVKLAKSIEEPLNLEPEEWAALASLVPPFTFEDLESQIGRGGAVRVIHTLHRLGVLEIFSQESPVVEVEQVSVVETTPRHEGESDWLDRLAGDVVQDGDSPTWRERSTVRAAEQPEEDEADKVSPDPAPVSRTVRGVAAPASTTLTDGVYDEIRRLRGRTNG